MMRQIVATIALAACSITGAQGQNSGMVAPKIASGTMIEPAKSFETGLTTIENEFVGLAKAMPAEKYNFAPSAAIFVESQKTDFVSPDNKGVRTFAENVKHVAQANYFYAGRASGLKPDVDVKAIADLKDKDQIVAALEASYLFAHKAFATLTAQNAFESVNGAQTRASMAGSLVAHGFDHFGHLAEYARMNGVVPPSSQK